MSETKRHLTFMFDGLEGIVAVARGVGGHYNGNGTYEFKQEDGSNGWLPDWFQWPADKDKLVEWVEQHADSDDLYVNPFLRRSKSRKRGEGKVGRVVWADIDRPGAGAPKLATATIRSGRGYHCYIRVEGEPLTEAEVEHFNRRYAKLLEADDCWSPDHVLRIAGTFNHKHRAGGGSSNLVQFDPAEGKTYNREELDVLLPTIEDGGDEAVEADLPTERPPLPGDLPPAVERIVHEKITAGMDKSSRTFALVLRCVEAGMTDTDVLACACAHAPTVERHGGRFSEIRRDVARILGKVRVDEHFVIPPPGAPFEVARMIRDDLFEGNRIARVGGLFWVYTGTHWREPTPDELRAGLYGWLSDKVYVGTKGALTPWNPTKAKLGNVEDALAALSMWNDIEPFGSGYCVALQNCILDIRTRETHPHTPEFFTTYALDFAYDPKADDLTAWTAFLDSIFGDDLESRECLQEMMGLVLSGVTSFQKIFLLLGPKRAGKGTIFRLLKALIGPENVCSPTLSMLGEHFGAAVLIGKAVALIGEAREMGRNDKTTQGAVERLLTISGEDMQTIPRKNREDWTGMIGALFVLSANMIPSFRDASGALASRIIMLQFTESFLGREDKTLDAKLYAERAAIFNWCMEGFDRLMRRGHFVQPQAGLDALRALEDMAAPVAAFVRDDCVLDPDANMLKSELFEAWGEWIDLHGHTWTGTEAAFYRDLYSAFPSQVAPYRPRVQTGDSLLPSIREQRVSGIRLQRG